MGYFVSLTVELLNHKSLDYPEFDLLYTLISETWIEVVYVSARWYVASVFFKFT